MVSSALAKIDNAIATSICKEMSPSGELIVFDTDDTECISTDRTDDRNSAREGCRGEAQWVSSRDPCRS